MTFASACLNRCLDIAKHPVTTAQFAGDDVRYSPEFEKLETELAKAGSLQGAGSIDWASVIDGAELLLREQSKDLRVAAWYIWGLYQRESFAGLQGGIALLHHLCTQHWAELHPRKERTRSAPLTWLFGRLEAVLTDDIPLRNNQALFRQLSEHLQALDACFSERLGEQAPLLLPLNRRLKEMLKRSEQNQPEPSATEAMLAQVKQAASQLINPATPIDNERDAQKSLRALQDGSRSLCGYWLKQKASDVRPLRLARSLLWLGIDSLPERNAEGVTSLRGVPADKLASYRERLEQEAFADLLVDLEASVARAPFWLDGQRLVWECLDGLDCALACHEVEVQLALLLKRFPDLPTLSFHDGQGFADGETQAWIAAHVLPHTQREAPASSRSPDAPEQQAAWELALQEALQRLRKDGLKVCVQLLKQGMQQAHGGRQRFHWQLAMVRLCMQAKKYDLAKTQLENLDQALCDSGITAWEPELALDVLRLLHSCCELLPQNHAVRERRDEVYRRLCHLDLEVVLD
ncbi:type VI secretion system protein TssA [Atopomonas sediminilitoris]|uniref:type VI secretion system protein TssA n=1 Tax=Atopomonas sediminilitoris TaxID=2919919 RepID=UPI001F4E7DE8|nr:type VI secretion system protein TssA [Atopomonas sediminilitoris]MCJ8170463.1 type VI secretion system protein TssA [Atopomonas sediminilitoris]